MQLLVINRFTVRLTVLNPLTCTNPARVILQLSFRSNDFAMLGVHGTGCVGTAIG